LIPAKDPELFAERPSDYNPVAELQGWLRRTTEGQHKYLVTGTVGNGKTSELYNASARLAEHRMVVFVDLWEHFRLRVREVSALERLEPWELVGLLGLAVMRAGEERFGHQWGDEPTQLQEAIRELRKADAGDGGAEIDVVALARGLVVAAGGAVGAMVGGPAIAAIGVGAAGVAVDTGLKVLETAADATSWTWRVGLLGGRRRSDQDTEVQALLDAVNGLIQALQQSYGKRLLLVVDGIDRVEDRKRLSILFVESALTGALACDQLFTVPLDNDISQRARAFRCYDLGNVPVLDRQDPSRHGKGIGFFRSLVDKRLNVVARNLATKGKAPPCDAPIPIDVVDRLAYYSGGVVREFVRMVRFAAGAAWDADVGVISQAIVDKTLRDARMGKEMMMNSEEIELLERVMEDPNHALPPGDVAHKLLRDHRLLPFPNEVPWYYPNPVLTLALLKPGRPKRSTP
jgi:hypothetical protein